MSDLTKQSITSFEEWKDSGCYFNYYGHKIFYTTNNTKKPNLLLLHGFPTSSWDYSFIWDELAKQFNLIAVDMLGFGLSDKPYNHTYSTHEQSNIIEAILKNQQISKLHILTHDYGNTITQELIARQIQTTDSSQLEILSVCFLNGGLFPESHGHTFLQGLLAGRFGNIIRHFITKKIAQKAIAKLIGKKNKLSMMELDIIWEFISYKQGNKIAHKLLQYINERKIYRQRWVSAIQYTKIPIRLINGPEDPVSGINMIENYKLQVTMHDVILIDGIGHFPHIEAPQQVLEAYLTFYNRLKISSS